MTNQMSERTPCLNFSGSKPWHPLANIKKCGTWLFIPNKYAWISPIPSTNQNPVTQGLLHLCSWSGNFLEAPFGNQPLQQLHLSVQLHFQPCRCCFVAATIPVSPNASYHPTVGATNGHPTGLLGTKKLLNLRLNKWTN